MKNGQKSNGLTTFLVSALAAGVAAVLLDCAVVLAEKSLSISMFGALYLLLFLGAFLLCRAFGKRMIALLEILLTVFALLCLTVFLLWKQFGLNSAYDSVDSGKEQLYADKRVMLIVPHQDDDINVLGGVMEEYVAYGSQVFPVFVTNGDYYGLAEVRFQEALDACAFIGIPEENVIFLGYGDQWEESGPHLYNAEPGVVMESANGKFQTYRTAAHPVFREGRDYTFDNLLEDMKAVILEYRPDVLICSDYDSHIDHKAVTLTFEKAMGMILQENEDYRPVVLKGFAYMSAWYAPFDYYDVNIRSTRNVYEAPCYQYPKIYRWEERIRLPVAASTLARSLLHSEAYEALRLYASQDANLHAAGVVNGDKVLWERNTNSLCYDAEIVTSSSDAGLLNDFMLLENSDLKDEDHLPFDGVWIPEETDERKLISVSLAEPSDIEYIVLYDHPSETENVLEACILFDDGSEQLTGPLDVYGAATRIDVRRKNVASFQIELRQTEGSDAGLTEIEAFREDTVSPLTILKLMDEDGNFVYDYWTPSDGNVTLGVYTNGDIPTVDAENYMVSWDNDQCSVTLTGSQLRVVCPTGESTVIRVESKDGTVSDCITVRNPGWLARVQCGVFQKLEEVLFVGYCKDRHSQLATVKILDTIRYAIKN